MRLDHDRFMILMNTISGSCTKVISETKPSPKSPPTIKHAVYIKHTKTAAAVKKMGLTNEGRNCYCIATSKAHGVGMFRCYSPLLLMF